MKSVSTIVVRYAETDSMGIVHHSRYFPWFEIGRGDLFAQSGMSYKQVEEAGIWLPLIEANCKYGSGARYLDELQVLTFIEELSGARIRFGYEIQRQGAPLATGYTIHAFTTPALKPVNLKKANPAVWALLEQIYTEG